MRTREHELRISGLGLRARFALSMTVALSVVAAVAGTVLYRSTTNVSEDLSRMAVQRAAKSVVVVGPDGPRYRLEGSPETVAEGLEAWSVTYEAGTALARGRFYRRARSVAAPLELIVPHERRQNARGRDDAFKTLSEPSDTDLKTRIAEALALTAKGISWSAVGPSAREQSGVESRVVEWSTVRERGGKLESEAFRGTLFRAEPPPTPAEWIVPDQHSESRSLLLRFVLVVMLLLVLVGAGVALWVGGQVVGPLNDIVDDVRQIAKGDLRHRTHARGGGEIELLARSLDRMTRDLAEAREAELELDVRQREMELAGGVREALIPVATPLVEGYDVGGAHLPGKRLGGDFHEYLELADGRVGLLVCDVSGQGVPAALVGATARAYLRSALLAGGDVASALRSVNRELVKDVRRGMYVTALYALLDPRSGEVNVACAGHKVPLMRYTAADRQLRLVQPEGIALGFDKGPVFDRRLELVRVDMEPGDRLFLTNSAPLSLKGADGQELGEKALYTAVLRHAALPTTKVLRGIKQLLSDFAGESGPEVDVSLVTVSREG